MTTSNKKLLGAPGLATRRTLLGAPGLATGSKKLLGAPGIASSSKIATRLEAIANRELFLQVYLEPLVASLLLVAMPGAPFVASCSY